MDKINLKLGDCFQLIKDISNKSVDISFTNPAEERIKNTFKEKNKNL